MDAIDLIRDSGVNIITNDGPVMFKIMEIFEIHEEAIVQDYATQAALYAYFSVLQADAERDVAARKQYLDEIYAECDLDWREDLDKIGEKYTEPKIKSLVSQDEKYTTVAYELKDAEYKVGLLKAITYALRMRAEMLISMGATLRQEYDMTDMNMKRLDRATEEVKTRLKSRRRAST